MLNPENKWSVHWDSAQTLSTLSKVAAANRNRWCIIEWLWAVSVYRVLRRNWLHQLPLERTIMAGKHLALCCQWTLGLQEPSLAFLSRFTHRPHVSINLVVLDRAGNVGIHQQPQVWFHKSIWCTEIFSLLQWSLKNNFSNTWSQKHKNQRQECHADARFPDRTLKTTFFVTVSLLSQYTHTHYK